MPPGLSQKHPEQQMLMGRNTEPYSLQSSSSWMKEHISDLKYGAHNLEMDRCLKSQLYGLHVGERSLIFLILVFFHFQLIWEDTHNTPVPRKEVAPTAPSNPRDYFKDELGFRCFFGFYFSPLQSRGG